jgi:hypothetical protein
MVVGRACASVRPVAGPSLRGGSDPPFGAMAASLRRSPMAYHGAAALVGEDDPALVTAMIALHGDAARRVAHDMGAAKAHAACLADGLARIAEIAGVARGVMVAAAARRAEAEFDGLGGCGRAGRDAGGGAGDGEHGGQRCCLDEGGDHGLSPEIAFRSCLNHRPERLSGE